MNFEDTVAGWHLCKVPVDPGLRHQRWSRAGRAFPASSRPAPPTHTLSQPLADARKDHRPGGLIGRRAAGGRRPTPATRRRSGASSPAGFRRRPPTRTDAQPWSPVPPVGACLVLEPPLQFRKQTRIYNRLVPDPPCRRGPASRCGASWYVWSTRSFRSAERPNRSLEDEFLK